MTTTEITATQLRCPCGGTRYRRILESSRYCTYGSNVESLDYSLQRCISCGLIRTWPEPAEHEHTPFRNEGFIAPYLERSELFDELLRPTVDHIV
ncbi:MAG TPA: hypothetical protein VM600_04510, partial [Actinomycetota bacterium]|nr:hypothetical protein [Actinomycetota bacterium]